MKRQVLFMAMVLIGLTSAKATTAGYAVLDGEDLNQVINRYAQPILFVERGVEFLIFPDGSFDFNTEIITTEDNNYYYKRSKRRNRRGTNRTYGAPGISYNAGNRGVIIRHDRQGRVRRIGNVFINYNRQGRLKRAGSVYITYRRGQLTQVGGLRILYNRHGAIIGTRGFVNWNNQGCGICGISGCATDHFDFNLDHNTDIGWNDDWNNDQDHYYYRKGGKTIKQKKIKK